MSSSSLKYTEEDWNEIRTKFSKSMMADADLASLGENAGITWPIRDEDEVPANYLGLEWDELQDHPNLIARGRVDRLLDILKETLAFDDPFSEMVDMAEEESDTDQDLERAIERLEIPRDYPINLTNLSQETQEFCTSEGIETIGDFLAMSRKMAKNIVIGGDFREMLNGLAEQDQTVLARYLPFRPGSKGLHLPEAIGLIVDSLSKDQRAALYRRYQLKPLKELPQSSLSSSEAELVEQQVDATAQAFLQRFPEQRQELQQAAENDSLDDYFSVLKDPYREHLATAIARKNTLGEAAPRKKGLFRKMRGFFGG